MVFLNQLNENTIFSRIFLGLYLALIAEFMPNVSSYTFIEDESANVPK